MSNTDPSPELSLFTAPYHRFLAYIRGERNRDQSSLDQNHPIEETLRLLAPERRRLILEELRHNNSRATPISVLAEQVACREYACERDMLDSDQRKRVYIACSSLIFPPSSKQT